MTERLYVPRTQSHPHLPPSDMFGPTIRENGRVALDDAMEVPLDEFGVPRPLELMRRVLATLDSSYKLPAPTNVHHVAFTRARYLGYPDDPKRYAAKYRESASLQLRMPVQLHNYTHAIIDLPPVPSLDIMRQRVIEQQQVNILAMLGNRSLKYWRWTDEQELKASLDNEKYQEHTDNARIYELLAHEAMMYFHDYLGKAGDAQVGLMPDRNVLSKIDFDVAVKHLGTLSTIRTINVDALRFPEAA